MSNLHDFLFGAGQWVDEPTKTGSTYYWKKTVPNVLERLISNVQDKLGINYGGTNPTPTPRTQYSPPPTTTPQQQYAQVQPTPQQQYNEPIQEQTPVQTVAPTQLSAIPSDLDILNKMVSVYGGPKSNLSLYTNQLLEGTQYDFWKQNPELLALIPQLETGSGKYITYPNNMFNYGIRDPVINKLFEQVGMEDAIRRTLKEIGSTGKTYADFRTGKPLTDEQLMEFAKTYEPNNADYGPNLINGRNHIRQTLGYGQ